MDLVEEGDKVIVLHVEESVIAIVVLCEKCLLLRGFVQMVPIVVIVNVAWALVVNHLPGIAKFHHSFVSVRTFQLSCRILDGNKFTIV